MIDSCWVGTAFKGNDGNIPAELNIERSKSLVNKALRNRAGIVIASGSDTRVEDTSVDGKHSLFAYKFINILKENKSFITSTKVFYELWKYHGEANAQQTPQRYTVPNWGHLDGDFIFVRKKS